MLNYSFNFKINDMKKQFTWIQLILTIIAYQVLQNNCNAQQNTLNNKNALLSFMKVNNYSLDEQFFRAYLKITKPSEYQLNQNDEFGYSKFYNSSKTEYSNDLENFDFTTRYVITKIIDFGTYNFQKQFFPLLIEYPEYFGQLNPTNIQPYSYHNFKAKVFNASYIQKELKMGETEAAAFTQKRKASNGVINRKVLSKIEYSIMNLKDESDQYVLTLYIHKISIFSDAGILQIITPDVDFYDKVNGIKIKDGQEKIYFDTNGLELSKENNSAASFYRIINYKAGKIDNPVIDYYNSGNKKMIGNFSVNLQTNNGSFQWFYENGQLSEQANYVRGVKHGMYESWYPNGDKQEEVNYIYDKKDGCDYMWSEDGRCLKSGTISKWTYSDNYFSYYENGKLVDYSKNCPIIKRKPQYSSANNVIITEDKSHTIIDIDGNVYETVTIGAQIWMTENLKTTKYNDGKSIPNVTNDSKWKNDKTPGYCWYNNDATYKSTSGALYNWHAVNTGKLAPKGWHVPSDAEWTTLTNYLAEIISAGQDINAAEIRLWSSPKTDAKNETGTTRLGGFRSNSGMFSNINKTGLWWSSTENEDDDSWVRFLNYGYSLLGRDGSFFKESGFSVRCIKD
jgi:uncharacterized protein (TIGR02145 family)